MFTKKPVSIGSVLPSPQTKTPIALQRFSPFRVASPVLASTVDRKMPPPARSDVKLPFELTEPIGAIVTASNTVSWTVGKSGLAVTNERNAPKARERESCMLFKSSESECLMGFLVGLMSLKSLKKLLMSTWMRGGGSIFKLVLYLISVRNLDPKVLGHAK